MQNTGFLTEGYDPITARQIRVTVQGMAHFSATGPLGTRCGECEFFGYSKQVRNAAGNVVSTTFRRRACAMFLKLTGKHGPAIVGNPESCRHFKRAEK